MDNSKMDSVANDEVVKAEVASELEDAQTFAKTLTVEDVKSGEWFVMLFQKAVQSYDRNVRAEYFQQKYPGLSPDEIADILIPVTVKYATIAGGITGAAVTANQIAALSSAGMTIALVAGAIGAEMIYLAHMQMKLVFDLSVVYDLQLDLEDPEDALLMLGYAMGAAPVEMLGKGLQVATRGGTQYAIKKYISKGTLRAVQDLGRKIGVKILQRSIIKYSVPIVSAAVGSSYNYVTTKSVGRIAKKHLKNRGKVTEELRQLVSRQNSYDLAFPAATMYVALVDGKFSAKEREFYRALLSRMSFEEHTQAEFENLLASEDNIINGIVGIEDDEIRRSLVDVLVLMAIYDGKLVAEERDFLIKAAAELNVPLDMDDVERRTEAYRVVVEKNVFQKATGMAGQTAGTVKGVATAAGGKVVGVFGNVFQRKKDEGVNVETDDSVVVCANCKNDVFAGHNFCPNCGEAMAT